MRRGPQTSQQKSARAAYHLRKKDPLAMCFRCKKRAVTTERDPVWTEDIALAAGLKSVEQFPATIGLCHQHSQNGKAAAARRAAIVKAAPEMLELLEAMVCWADPTSKEAEEDWNEARALVATLNGRLP